MSDVKQVIVVRLRYPDKKGGTRKIRWGKLMTQVAHATNKVFFDKRLKRFRFAGTSRPDYGTVWGPPAPDKSYLVVPLTDPMNEWVESEMYTKALLGVDSCLLSSHF